MGSNDNEILDWDDLTPEDQAKADSLMQELNTLFSKYIKEEDKPCDSSTLDD